VGNENWASAGAAAPNAMPNNARLIFPALFPCCTKRSWRYTEAAARALMEQDALEQFENPLFEGDDDADGVRDASGRAGWRSGTH